MRRLLIGWRLAGRRAPRRRTLRWVPAVGTVEGRVLPAVTIAVDYTYDAANFFDTQAKRDLMQQAASAVASTLNDTLAAIAPSGTNSWTASFPNPNTGATQTLNNLNVAANTIVLYVGGGHLPGSSEAGLGSTGGYNASGDQAFLNAVVGRGKAAALGSNPTAYATWGGSITFDNSGGTSWYFGASANGLTSAQTDFLSVAEHEIGHVLGLGTSKAWSSKVSNGAFTGSNAVAAFGNQPVPLNPTLDHWAQSVRSGGGPALMDPVLVNGTRVVFTPLDYAALADLGWQVQVNAPVFQLASSAYSALENSGTLTIVVTRTGGLGAASVSYATSDGTARAGVDYTATTDTLSFGPGETSKTISIPVLNDAVVDNNETFTLTLSAPTAGATLGTPSSATVTLVDTTSYRPAGDFDGDGRTDFGLFRQATAQWIVVRTTAGLISPIPAFGAPKLADIPVVGDFDGTGRAQLAVFRPSTAQWIVLGPNGGHVLGTFGAPNLFDIPVPGDYDGVGYTEMAVFRPSTGQWFVQGPTGGRLLGTFGGTNMMDIPAPGDYDGDGKTDLAVFRPSTAQWFVLGPTGGRLLGTFGGRNLMDVPVPGDWDGIGKTEMAVYRPSTGQWFVQGPTGGRLMATFGTPNYADLPTQTSVGSLVKLGATGPGVKASAIRPFARAALTTAAAPAATSPHTAQAATPRAARPPVDPAWWHRPLARAGARRVMTYG